MAKKKFTYEFIKNFVESVDYVFLLSEEEYGNVKTPLKLRCPMGHVYTTQWGHFYHRGARCKACNKHTLDFAVESFSSEGYTLLEEEYVNCVSKMPYKCPQGHKSSMTWSGWRSGNRCPECVKTPYEEIVSYFDSFGYNVLSDEEEYTGAKFKFKFLCPNGHTSSMNWYNFKRGNRCGLCAPNVKKDISEIREEFSKRGYKLLSDVYVGGKENLDFICPNGHVHHMTWSNFKKNQDCAKCRGSVSKLSQEWLDLFGIELREHRIKGLGGKRGISVDGFDPDTNTVYEFLGDYWHGNPKVYNSEDINYNNKKTFGDLYRELKERFSILEKAGYNIVYIWESDFLSI